MLSTINYFCKNSILVVWRGFETLLNTLLRLSCLINLESAKPYSQLFYREGGGQSNYCPWIMISLWKSNNRINQTHKRARWLCTGNENLSFNELLRLPNDVTAHVKHIHFLLIDIYKCINGLSLAIAKPFLSLQTTINHY